VNDTLIGRIEQTLAESEHPGPDVIRTVALWVNESGIDLYAEDRAAVVNSLLDQANMNTLSVEKLLDRVMESYYRSQAIFRQNTSAHHRRIVGSVVREIVDLLDNDMGKLDVSRLADAMQGK
jgi:predicted nucleic-acid-binding protein